MRDIKKPIVFAGILVMLGIASGCTPLREVRFDTLQNSVRQRTEDLMQRNVGDHVQDFDRMTGHKEDRIVTLEDGIRQVIGIKDASVIIIENAAIVSVNLTEGTGNTAMPNIRRDIERRVKELDKSIRYVSVTASPEMIERLHEITGGNDNRGQRGETITNLRPPI